MTGPIESDAQLSSRIDAALHEVGTATPAPGLEGRILTRLAAQRSKLGALPGSLPSRAPRRLQQIFVPVFGFASAVLMCAAIVGGSVSHSRRTPPGQVAPPVIHLPGTGVGAASAVHPGAPASAPVPAGPAARGRSVRHASPGRARIAPHAHKAPGVAVPLPESAAPQNE